MSSRLRNGEGRDRVTVPCAPIVGMVAEENHGGESIPLLSSV